MSTTQPKTLMDDVTHAVRTAAERWHAFWFAPADPLPLGLIRILTGWMLVYNLWVWGSDLTAFFASDGLQPLASITAFHQNDYVFSFLYWVPDASLHGVHLACLIVAVMFMLGIMTRVTSVLAFLITISYSQRVPVANFGLDQLLGMLCLYSAIGPSGASLSIDALLRRLWRRKQGIPRRAPALSSAQMTLRLIQIHVCIIYFWAGFAKLKGDSWWTGEAMWQVIANQEYQTMDLTWMAWFPWLPYLIAHVTVAWEVSFCAMVWNKRLRPIWLAMGTAMHIGIGAFLGMWTFGLIMTFPYFAFSDGRKWRRRLALFGSADAAEAPQSVEAAAELHASSADVTQAAAELSLPAVDDKAAVEFDPWAASEPYVTGQPVAAETAQKEFRSHSPEDSAVDREFVISGAELPQPHSSSDNKTQAVAEQHSVDRTLVTEQPRSLTEEISAIETVVSPQNPQSEALTAKVAAAPVSIGVDHQAPVASVEKTVAYAVAGASTDAAQELFRQTMGMSSEPVRLKPAVKRIRNGARGFQNESWFDSEDMDYDKAPSHKEDDNQEEDRDEDRDWATASEQAEPAAASFAEETDGDPVMDDDYVIEGTSAATDAMVYAATPSGLLDSATLDDWGEASDPALAIDWQADWPENEIPEPFDRDESYSGAVMSEQKPNADVTSDSPDASHVMTTSKRMDRIKPKTANSLTGAPPPKVEGRVEDSVLAPETEVLLVAVHAPERNTFRTYLRRHDIPCRAAVSAENAVSVVLSMKPAAVLISGSMMNPEEIITLVDDLSDMVDAPILALLTGSQIKLLSNDPLAAHVLQYPASLRQIRSELTGILLDEGNARPRCSLRSAMADE